MRVGITTIAGSMLAFLAACQDADAPPAQPAAAPSRAAVETTGETAPASTPADPVASPVPPPATAASAVSPCLEQDGRTLTVEPLRAVGTEPFWGAAIEGRCVTYSHPDDQNGTRVWTRFTADGQRGTWTGTLEGRPFVLRTTPQPGCSDGMSDRRYPIAVALTVGGEERQGCADAR